MACAHSPVFCGRKLTQKASIESMAYDLSSFLLFIRVVFYYAVIGVGAAAQTRQGEIQMKTAGSCSPAIADVKGNVTITCYDVSPAGLKKLDKVPALLEQLVRDSVNRSELIARLANCSVPLNPPRLSGSAYTSSKLMVQISS